MPLSQSDAPATKKIVMPHRRDHIIKQARERIARIRASLDAMDYLCSGTLLRRMKMCGKPGCRWHRGPRRTSRPVLRMGTHERGQAPASHGNARASRSPAPGYRQLLQGQEAHEGLGARDRTARRQRGTPRALTRLNKGAAKIIQKLHLRHAESKTSGKGEASSKNRAVNANPRRLSRANRYSLCRGGAEKLSWSTVASNTPSFGPCAGWRWSVKRDYHESAKNVDSRKEAISCAHKFINKQIKARERGQEKNKAAS